MIGIFNKHNNIVIIGNSSNLDREVVGFFVFADYIAGGRTFLVLETF